LKARYDAGEQAIVFELRHENWADHGWRYLTCRDLDFSINTQPLPRSDAAYHPLVDGNMLYEEVAVGVPVEALADSAPQSFAGRICHDDFELTTFQLDSLREFISRVRASNRLAVERNG
jgi:hypothetical protein